MEWWLLFLAGVLTGLRSFTPLAVLTFFQRHGHLKLGGPPLAFIDTMAAHIVITLLALGELVADKLPKTPSRTSAIGLSGRLIMGALVAVCVAMSAHAGGVWQAAAIGAIGAIAGTYAGWFVRTRAVIALKIPDWPVALCEDAVCILGSWWVFAHAAM